MNANSKSFIGIDVSKTTLEVAIWQEEHVEEFSNDVEGIRKLCQHFKKRQPALLVILNAMMREQQV